MKNSPSKKQITKKQHEIDMLYKALELIRSNEGIPHGIANLIDEDHVDASGESPDFIAKIAESPSRFIGIEHFMVDQHSHKKKGSYHSDSTILQKRISNLQQRGRASLRQGKGLTPEILKELEQILSVLYQDQFACGVKTLGASFTKTLEKHLSNIAKYQSRVRQIARKNDGDYAGIAFFIDIHCDFPKLFINEPCKSPRRCSGGELPLFPPILSLLRVAAEKVDWIILSTSTTITNEMVSAHIIDCSDFDASLRSQNMLPCRDLSRSLHQPSSKMHPLEFKLEKTRNGYGIDYTSPERKYSTKEFIRSVEESACDAIDCMESQEMFATTYGVQLFIDVAAPYLLKYKTPGVHLQRGVVERMLNIDSLLSKRKRNR